MGPLFLGGGTFLLSMFVITPHLRMQEGLTYANQYIGFYWKDPGEHAHLTQIILLNLHNAWANMSSPLNISFIKELLGPLNFLPLLSPHALFLGAPVLLQNFLGPTFQMHTIYYHYVTTITVFIFLALAASLKFLKIYIRPLIFYIVVFFTGLTCMFNTIDYLPEFSGRMASWPDRLDPVRWQMVDVILQTRLSWRHLIFWINLPTVKICILFIMSGETTILLPANRLTAFRRIYHWL